MMSKQQSISLQDDRERKGEFYTPLIWVEKSQEYLAKVFGRNWTGACEHSEQDGEIGGSEITVLNSQAM